MSDILWNSRGTFRCEIFDKKSEVFDLNSVKGKPGSPRLKPEWKCFIPSLVGSGSNFTGNKDSNTIQIRESTRQGSTYYLETLCHPCPVDEFEDDSCRDAEAQVRTKTLSKLVYEKCQNCAIRFYLLKKNKVIFSCFCFFRGISLFFIKIALFMTKF